VDIQRELAQATDYVTYEHNPNGFICDILQEVPWSIQQRIADAVRDYPIVAVPSCFGSGKDWIAARIVAWWVCTGGVAVTTADTFRQVRDILWRELRRAHARGKLPGSIPPVECRWENGLAWAVGIKPDDTNAEGFQGIHSRKVLVVADEANGIPAELMEAMKGLVVNEDSRILAIGNPHEPTGAFYEMCRSATAHVIHISVFDTPNFSCICGERYTKDTRDDGWPSRHRGDGHGPLEAISAKAQAELVGPFWVEQRRKEALEGTPWWKAKVEGEFPDSASDQLISLSLIESARQLPYIGDAKEAAGIDVARFGSDDTVKTEGAGNGPEEITVAHGQDTMQTAGWAARFFKDRRGTLAVDDGGVGGGVTDRVREQRLPGVLLAVNAGESPDNDPDDHFMNMRSQLWWSAREAFYRGEISLQRLPEDVYVRLRSELTAPRYKFSSGGKIIVESKADMKDRGVPSPDMADSFNLWLYARSRARRRTSFGAAA
jgi:hypothetical protein